MNKLARLWQPRTLLFWQWVFFNIMSSVCAWAMRALPLNTTGLVLIGSVALLNCGFSLLAMWRLMQTPEPSPDQGARSNTSTSASSPSDNTKRVS